MPWTYSQFYSILLKGVEELKSLAVRFHHALPNLFEDKFDRMKFEFRFTNTERILESYRRFADGLFGENANQNISIEPLDVNSILLNPYTICDSWKQSLKSSFAERKKLEKSLMFTRLVRDVSIRLGFKRSLGLEKILDMYNMCRYGFAWEIKGPSPWCAVSASHSTLEVTCIEFFFFHLLGIHTEPAESIGIPWRCEILLWRWSRPAGIGEYAMSHRFRYG